MNRIIGLLFSLVLFFLPAFGQDLNTELNEKFKNHSLVKLDSAAILRKVDKKEIALIGTFPVYLETNNLFSNRLIASKAPATVKPVKGKIVGFSSSEVRLTIGENLKGYIFNGQLRYYIEPAVRYSSHAKPDDYIIYLGSDVIGFGVIDLSDDMAEGQKMAESTLQSASSSNVYAANSTILKVIEIATDADYEYVQAEGGATQANNQIVNIINMAEGVYESQLGITFDITFQNTWTSPDPYTATTANPLLAQFASYWENNFSGIHRDVAHLFTGNIVTNAAGNAYADAGGVNGVICRFRQFSYGFTVRQQFVFPHWIIFAHEVGHNLGATHVDSVDCANTIMNTAITDTANSFCQTSINQITNYVNSYGTCLQQITVDRTKFDFDKDGKADISVFRPSEAKWYVQRSQLGFIVIPFGISTDKITPADYDGDGKTDYAVFRDGTWYVLRSSNGVTTITSFGLAGDKPVPADYDGDGKADLAIFRPSTGEWWILRSTGGTVTIQFGTSTDKLVPDDYTGDGKADIAFFRPSTGEWFVLRSEDFSFYSFPFGLSGDIPTSADFNGDKKADYVIYRNGTWYIQYSSGGTTAHLLGMSGDIPVPADYDGDGLADLATFRQGLWDFVNTDVQFGSSGDIPIPGFLVAQ